MNSSNIHFEVRNAPLEIAAAIIQEAAQWLITTHRMLWPLELLSLEKLQEKCAANEVYVGYVGDEPAVTAFIQEMDPFLWPNDGRALYIHKLSVRRAFAGLGLPTKMLSWAEQCATGQSKDRLRLDCAADRPKLCSFYEAHQFDRIDSRRYGAIEVALYEKKLTRPQTPA